jgi:hypothetical protein
MKMLRWMRDKISNVSIRERWKVDQIAGSQTARGGGRPRKFIRETIKKNLEINKFL